MRCELVGGHLLIGVANLIDSIDAKMEYCNKFVGTIGVDGDCLRKQLLID